VKIYIRQAETDPDAAIFDVAERKGIGHPDSLADLVADSFSQAYIRWCQTNVGIIPNHWVDKVNLVGAAAEVWFGGYTVTKPVDCYLFGKITDRVGDTVIPIEDLFSDVVTTVLPTTLGDKRVLDHLRLHVNNSSGIAMDHDPQFYRPDSVRGAAIALEHDSVANDTVICVGASHPGVAATVAMRLETEITGNGFRTQFPAIGTDVKAMVVRCGADLDITAAIPFHPEATASWLAYCEALEGVHEAVTQRIKHILTSEQRADRIETWSLHVNTKDVPGRGYIAPFGTSLGKGDCGAVGRGNRLSGAIEPLRPASCEAPSGKNPLHHAGKIYSSLTTDIAKMIKSEIGAFAEVTIAARNGDALNDPAYVLVSVDGTVDRRTDAHISRLVQSELAEANRFVSRFIELDLIDRFRSGGSS
jgi:S-adenosylmethionine synthetase